jgi:hypothetical protein
MYVVCLKRQRHTLAALRLLVAKLLGSSTDYLLRSYADGEQLLRTFY